MDDLICKKATTECTSPTIFSLFFSFCLQTSFLFFFLFWGFTLLGAIILEMTQNHLQFFFYIKYDLIFQGMDLYFKRHDGQAVTCEEFFAAMRDANDVDFSNFLSW